MQQKIGLDARYHRSYENSEFEDVVDDVLSLSLSRLTNCGQSSSLQFRSKASRSCTVSSRGRASLMSQGLTKQALNPQ
jgi:hypothetical protein